MKKAHKTEQSGFSLIELLVVISIIGVLSSIIIVALQNAKQSAQNAYTSAEVRQIQNQLAIYALDHDGAYPNPTGGNDTWYCIGSAAVCVSPYDLGGLSKPGNNLAADTLLTYALPDETDTPSLWSFFETKKVEAATQFTQFIRSASKYPTYYWCAVAKSSLYGSTGYSLCSSGNAWVYGPKFSGNTVTYAPVEAGGTGSPTAGWSAH